VRNKICMPGRKKLLRFKNPKMEGGKNGSLWSLSVADFDELGVKSFGSDFATKWIIKFASYTRFVEN